MDLKSLLGDCELSQDLAKVDWSKTALGPVSGWPRSLHTILSAVIASRFSMWMAWGPDLTFFCNAAYRHETLGVKYPWALGRPSREVWAEIWPEIGPRIESVLAGGQATWDEALPLILQRSGFPEETYHTFSYSPLPGDDGTVAGMLCVVTEDTERVIAQRRMATLQELSAACSAALGEEETLQAACVHLGENPYDLPFTLIYLRADTAGTGQAPSGATARLACATGGMDRHPAAAATVGIGAPGALWPLSPEASVLDLDGIGELPAGVWPTAPRQALVVPLAQSGAGAPWGWLITGLNRYRPLDESYRGFLQVLAGQLAAGIASARAFEAERARAEQLAELDQAKTTFFTNVSHELRTPLTLILGPVEDLLAAPSSTLSGTERNNLQLVAGNAARLLNLVNTLLDLAGASSGRTRPVFAPVDIADLTRQVCAMFESAITRAGLGLTYRIAAAPAQVWVDVDAWTKIVSNLLSNAVKYTFTGAITVSLQQMAGGTSGDEPPVVELAVTDTGTGIPAQELPHLFERFHRVAGARSRTHEGTGIGLALTAELVALHRGRIEVSSVLGSGSTFTVRIPTGRPQVPEEQLLDRDHPSPTAGAVGLLAEMERWLPATPGTDRDTAPDPRAQAQDASPARRAPSGAPRVLVVDDNPDMRGYVAELLAEQYLVRTAGDGIEALRMAREQVPDLVLTDVMMPELDGFGLLSALRADPSTAGVPVVMLSARAGQEGIVEGLEAGADDYLSKPFSSRELLARVRANLELDRSRRIRAELERSRDLLEQAQQLARLGSWELDLITGQVQLSPNLRRMLALDPAGQPITRQALGGLLHPDDRQPVENAIAAAAGGAAFGCEARARATDGRELLTEIFGEIERDAHGKPVRLHGSVQDITERRRVEAELRAAAAAREVAARDHQIADELQTALLPAARFDTEHLQVSGYYRAGVAGTQVGGDWYDVIDLGEGRTALAVGDVMGRGIRAAALMGQIRSVIRAFAHLNLPPATLLRHCDEVVSDLAPGCLITCLYAVHDPTTARFDFANAGHVPPLLADPRGAVRVLDVPATTPLGTGHCSPGVHQVAIDAGDILALYTDGLVERRDRPLDPGIARLGRAISRWSPGQDLACLVNTQLPEGTEDDVALLLARVRHSGADEPDRPAMEVSTGE